MSKPISIIVPTYRESEALSLCLQSIIEGQYNKENQTIVVVDGYYSENEEVLSKYKDKIDILNLEENVGLCRATNLGVYNSRYQNVLIINDDNVVSKDFDKILSEDYKDGMLLVPNQIEPFPSIFPQFYIKDLGRDPGRFNLERFRQEEKIISETYGKQKGYLDNAGSTLPIFMSRIDYIRLGGWDESYPRTGVCADWDFFLKAQLSNIQMKRTYRTHLYHFVTGTSNTPEAILRRQQDEQRGWEYSFYKWGARIVSDPHTNKKYLAN